ncbi:MAG: SDR family NAD(P)-dependent oxidoreductase, partial [Ferruginibacter sp.]|nr:SDR family NAD(P)-dependent oxidoreductase [Ferruginibacter sp.]
MDNSINLKNKNVLVTGGSRGIGAGIAKAMAACGANVLINYRSHKESAAELSDFLQKEYVVKTASFCADISKKEEVEKMFLYADEHFGSIDILVNNAGCES